MISIRDGSVQKTTLICLLDKGDPPEHSFITGMLARVLPEAGNIHVQIVVAKRNSSPEGLSARRYHRAALLPILPALPRRGIRRLMLVASAFVQLGKLINKAKQRRERVAVLVRNDPVLLYVAKLRKRRIDTLVFQSSFPLEETHRSAWKRWLHRTAYRFAGSRVDGVLAVSPRGLARVRALVRFATRGEYIPLLCDFPVPSTGTDAKAKIDDGRTTRFVYLGTHDKRRQAHVIVSAAVAALEGGADAEFAFIGGSPAEIEALGRERGVGLHISSGRIRFVPQVPREEIPRLLATFDVGMSLIPPVPIYREASPTKLAEYLGAGLAVLASTGIALQEQMVRQSGAGRLVRFDVAEVARAIAELCDTDLREMKEQAAEFARQNLDYRGYVGSLRRLLEMVDETAQIEKFSGAAHGSAR